MPSEIAPTWRAPLNPDEGPGALLAAAGITPKSTYEFQTDDFRLAVGQEADGTLVLAVVTADGQGGLFRSVPG